MNFNIEKAKAREILDSRGNPTLLVEITLENGIKGSASVPSGASTGIHEALELRDNDKTRYLGKGVLNACDNVKNLINKEIKGLSVLDQEVIDETLIKLDGTPQKSYLGANAILGVSLACLHAHANTRKKELFQIIAELFSYRGTFSLPTPMINVINGGKHADTNLDFQEFMVVPRADIPYDLKLQMVSEVFHSLGAVLKRHQLDTDLGNEGGYAPDVKNNEEPLKLISEAIEELPYRPGKEIFIALDVAASTFYRPSDNKYVLACERKTLNKKQFFNYYLKLLEKYPIISIEDPLYEDDFSSWSEFKQILPVSVLLVGDDLYATNAERLQLGINANCTNALIIKPNQVGTITETLKCIKLAKEKGLSPIISHRSGETNDYTIADLAVGVGAPYIKSGSCAHGERLSKYNRLLLISDILASGSI